MKIMNSYLILCFCAIVSAYDLSYFPPPLKVPPGNATLTKLILGNSKIVAAPLRAPAQDNDWSLDITSCTDSSTWSLSCNSRVL